MDIRIYIKQKHSDVNAEAIYQECKTVVLPGGTISKDFAEHIQGGKKAKSYRNNSEYVNEDGVILKKCEFTSPSTAAQFVTGRSTNGYTAWKVGEKKSLGDYLKEKGLR